MEEDVVPEPLLVAVSISLLYQPLYARVEPFDRSVGYPVVEEVEDLRNVLFEHASDFLHSRQARAYGPLVPQLEALRSLGSARTVEELAEDLLDGPGPPGLQTDILHRLEALQVPVA